MSESPGWVCFSGASSQSGFLGFRPFFVAWSIDSSGFFCYKIRTDEDRNRG